MSEPEGAARAARRPPGSLAVTWVGHATALIELDGTRILTDPLLRRRVGPLVRIAPPADPGTREGIDAVILSHLHADHVDPPSLRMLHGAPRIIAPRGSGAWLRRRGLGEVHELGEGERVRVGGVTLTATHAAHDPRGLPRRPAAPPIGYLLEGSGSCYFAGDTDLFDAMADLAGRVELALLPIWGWGPALGPGHLDPARAARAAAIIGPLMAVPIHWGTYALPRPARGREDPQAPARRFLAGMAAEAPAVQARVLAPGQRIELPAARASGRGHPEGGR